MAIQVAEECRDALADGAWFVDLAGLSDPALVTSAVATALGVREQPEQTLRHSLEAFLTPRELLLILDNCEHLVEACAVLAESLLSAAPADPRHQPPVPGAHRRGRLARAAAVPSRPQGRVNG